MAPSWSWRGRDNIVACTPDAAKLCHARFLATSTQRLELVQGEPHGGKRRLGDGVVYFASLAPRGDEAGLAKGAEVMRDERLAEAEHVHDVAHAPFTVDEGLEDAEARLVTEGAESEGGNSSRPIGDIRHAR